MGAHGEGAHGGYRAPEGMSGTYGRGRHSEACWRVLSGVTKAGALQLTPMFMMQRDSFVAGVPNAYAQLNGRVIQQAATTCSGDPATAKCARKGIHG